MKCVVTISQACILLCLSAVCCWTGIIKWFYQSLWSGSGCWSGTGSGVGWGGGGGGRDLVGGGGSLVISWTSQLFLSYLHFPQRSPLFSPWKTCALRRIMVFGSSSQSKKQHMVPGDSDKKAIDVNLLKSGYWLPAQGQKLPLHLLLCCLLECLVHSLFFRS